MNDRQDQGMRRILDQPVDVALRPILADLEASGPAAPQADVRRQVQWSHLYDQVRPLGRGGMSRTILARERSSGRLVCVKELFGAVDARMLAQEFKALNRLSHPNIERVFHVEMDASPIYMVAEYIEGQLLSEHVRAWPERDEKRIAALMAPIADALAYAHANDVIHRDIKPENILVENRHARPVLLDLGLAIVDSFDFEERITAAGRAFGTPLYMAPEQVQAAVLTPAVDVYAFGVMLYELVTGTPAFRGSMRAVIEAKMTRAEGLEIPDRFWRPRWRNLSRLVYECTAPKSDARWSASRVAEVLRALA